MISPANRGTFIAATFTLALLALVLGLYTAGRLNGLIGTTFAAHEVSRSSDADLRRRTDKLTGMSSEVKELTGRVRVLEAQVEELIRITSEQQEGAQRGRVPDLQE